jgi:hypothetical protein
MFELNNLDVFVGSPVHPWLELLDELPPEERHAAYAVAGEDAVCFQRGMRFFASLEGGVGCTGWVCSAWWTVHGAKRSGRRSVADKGATQPTGKAGGPVARAAYVPAPRFHVLRPTVPCVKVAGSWGRGGLRVSAARGEAAQVRPAMSHCYRRRCRAFCGCSA